MELQSEAWLKLPRLGKEAFVQLMRAGVKYESNKGFLITQTTNIPAVEAILSSALGEPVKVITSLHEPDCFICSEPVGCGKCTYIDICAKNAAYCLCPEHSDTPTSFIVYRLEFTDRAKQLIGAATEKPSVERKEWVQWSEKYRPSDLNFMVGNEESRLGFLRWLSTWKGGKAALLMGPPGVGKTTVVQLAARKLGLPLLQLNASDERSKSRLHAILSEGALSRGLTGQGLLVFLDEVDGIEGRADYGAVEFIKDTISSSKNPIVMAANDEDSDVVRKLQGKTTTVFRFDRVMPRLIEMYLLSILEREGKSIEPKAVQQIVMHANGDIRAAINDLQTSLDFRPETVERDEQTGVREAFGRIFAARSYSELYQCLEMVEISRPSDLLKVVFNNIVANSKDSNEIAEALRQLSWLDTIVMEMEFGQRWELLRYFRRILAGILMATKREGWRYVDYDPAFFPNRFSIWNDGRVLRAVAMRVASDTHASRAQSILLYPNMVLMAKKGSKAAKRLVCFDDSSERVCDKEYEWLSEKVGRV